MKIAYDAKRYYHNRTGLGNYSRTLVNSMQQLFPNEEFVLYDEKSYTRTFRLGRKAKQDGCQLYHGLSNELPMDCLKADIRSVVTIHDVAWRTFPDMYTIFDRHIYDWKYGWAARHADRVVCISESTKHDVQRFYGVPEERLLVIYQPVQQLFYERIGNKANQEKTDNPANSTPTTPLPSNYLLQVGSVNSRKNLLGTLTALSRIPAEQRPPLVVVGSGREYMERCRSFAAAHLRPDDVIWLGSVNDNYELQRLYAGALAMVYPSHYEGFGLPVVEALLQGTPVLTSSVSSLPEAAGPGALLVNPADTDDICHALRSLIDDAQLRQRLAEEGERYCRCTFTVALQAQQMMQLYSSLV